MGDSLKELEETAYWLELLVESGTISPQKLAALLDETSQLIGHSNIDREKSSCAWLTFHPSSVILHPFYVRD